MQQNKKYWIQRVCNDGMVLQYAPPEPKKDIDVVFAAVRRNGLALQYIDDSLKQNIQVVLVALSQNGLALRYVHHSLKQNKQLVLRALRQNGLSLEFAHYSLKENKQMVLAAMSQNAQAFQFAAASLQNDTVFVNTALLHNIDKDSLDYAYKNIDVLNYAYQGDALTFATVSGLNSFDAIEKAVAHCAKRYTSQLERMVPGTSASLLERLLSWGLLADEQTVALNFKAVISCNSISARPLFDLLENFCSNYPLDSKQKLFDWLIRLRNYDSKILAASLHALSRLSEELLPIADNIIEQWRLLPEAKQTEYAASYYHYFSQLREFYLFCLFVSRDRTLSKVGKAITRLDNLLRHQAFSDLPLVVDALHKEMNVYAYVSAFNSLLSIARFDVALIEAIPALFERMFMVDFERFDVHIKTKFVFTETYPAWNSLATILERVERFALSETAQIQDRELADILNYPEALAWVDCQTNNGMRQVLQKPLVSLLGDGKRLATMLSWMAPEQRAFTIEVLCYVQEGKCTNHISGLILNTTQLIEVLRNLDEVQGTSILNGLGSDLSRIITTSIELKKVIDVLTYVNRARVLYALGENLRKLILVSDQLADILEGVNDTRVINAVTRNPDMLYLYQNNRQKFVRFITDDAESSIRLRLILRQIYEKGYMLKYRGAPEKAKPHNYFMTR